MNIQGKPAAANTNPALEAFRDGKPLAEVAQAAEKAKEQEAEPTPAPANAPQDDDASYNAREEIAKRALNQRISKSTRMSQYHSLCLREYSAQQTRQSGRNVNEADILDEALSEYFKKRKFILK